MDDKKTNRDSASPRLVFLSSIVHRPSSIVHRPSSIVHHPSSIVHRPSPKYTPSRGCARGPIPVIFRSDMSRNRGSSLILVGMLLALLAALGVAGTLLLNGSPGTWIWQPSTPTATSTSTAT